MKRNLPIVILVFQLAVVSQAIFAATQNDEQVDDQRLPTGRLIQPAGTHATMQGRPVDLTVDPLSGLVFVKDRHHIRIYDPDDMDLLHSIDLPGGASLTGIEALSDGRVAVTNARRELFIVAGGEEPGDDRFSFAESFAIRETIELPADCFPCGVAVSQDDARLYVCLSKLNTLGVIDLATGDLTHQIPVGVAPFDVALDHEHGRAFVTNIGGRRALDDDPTASSAGTETVVDDRGIASTGSVSVIDLDEASVIREIATGLHPTGVVWDHSDSRVIVANANDDSISVIDGESWESVDVIIKPDLNLPFGSMPNALCLIDELDVLLIALAGNNAIAVVDVSEYSNISIEGLIPTAWFPGGVTAADDALYVSNVKGIGSRAQVRDEAHGRNSHDHLGSIQQVPMRDVFDDGRLEAWTLQVKQNGLVPQILRANEVQRPADSSLDPLPVPAELGDPSVFQHVIYVIKENRTYDQVFGDMADARGAPELCVFPEDVTPNHHALARRFGVLDNYYCNGILSADGHSWATEGNVTPYLERAFGGFARSYTFGDDPITYSSSGFIWDHILAAGLSFRNYGEMDYAQIPDGLDYQGVWEKYERGEAIEFGQNIGIEKLARYSARDYPGWNMRIPDVLRMDRFLAEFRDYEANGGFPNFSLVYLPQDHLGGGVTSRAHMADNDLALGRLVEAVSQSEYWAETVIFVIEDDPQNGYDHVDGHRSVCLVISPYSRPGVHTEFYNQTSVLRTMLHVLGIPPMNQQDSSAPLMTECFQVEPNLDAYTALPANYALNESPAPVEQQTAVERRWRTILQTVPIERTGMKTETDEDNLNRFVWHEMMGWETAYPTAWAGAHGRGLKELGLIVEKHEEADE